MPEATNNRLPDAQPPEALTGRAAKAQKWLGAGLLILGLLQLTGCGFGPDSAASQTEPENAPAAAEKVAVAVVTVARQRQSLHTELSGRVVAQRIAEVRPQVRGLVAERLFEEGASVAAGELLYRIQDDRYQALWHQARADLAIARASLASAEISRQRYQQLVGVDGISQHEYELSKAEVAKQQAEVQAREAALKSAELDLQQTQIRAPVSGVIGRAEVNQGALVSAEQTVPLARIQQLDPVYVDLVLPARQLLALKRRQLQQTDGHSLVAHQPVKLTLEDGLDYGSTGSVTFADSRADTSTGMVTLRAQFANPDGLLVPGMFVRAELTLGEQVDVVVVPQQAVNFDEQGRAFVWRVENGAAQIRLLTLLEQRPDANTRHHWLVDSGLESGDQVVTEGIMRLYPGVLVTTTEWQPTELNSLAMDDIAAGLAGSSP
ncbi:efflux RND transporter periplasmic adaptor subunit [Oceanobacter mangrovi]|uniref:efflux RND transporter periplasmic adaptor subunit n=1 Tax=Oceanobacter mangrovi TaxID=2862510 RepID=UPI001C8D5C09